MTPTGTHPDTPDTRVTPTAIQRPELEPTEAPLHHEPFVPNALAVDAFLADPAHDERVLPGQDAMSTRNIISDGGDSQKAGADMVSCLRSEATELEALVKGMEQHLAVLLIPVDPPPESPKTTEPDHNPTAEIVLALESIERRNRTSRMRMVEILDRVVF